jgi:hemoglobin
MKIGEKAFWIDRGMVILVAALLVGASGCRSSRPKAEQKDQQFFTSGSREADQRASQRMAKSEQLTGKEENVKKAEPSDEAKSDGKPQAAQAEKKLTLYDRLGGEQRINEIIEDFTPRVLDDPRVNWERKAVSGRFSWHRNRAARWEPTSENVAILKKHLVQFLSLATGGPAFYEGRDISPVHAGMHISNPEFDAAIGDMKATLDRLKVPNAEQKELLAILESTRPQIVTVR